MKVAVVSDIHDNEHNLLRSLERMKEQQVENILCLGDIINPGVAKILADCGIPVFSIWGNNDGDKVLITKLSLSKESFLEVSDKTYASIEIDGRSIFMTHYPDLVRQAALSGIYDVVFYGHDHTRYDGLIGECLVINPGEISAQKTRTATYALYDTVLNQFSFVELEDAVHIRTETVDIYHAE